MFRVRGLLICSDGTAVDMTPPNGGRGGGAPVRVALTGRGDFLHNRWRNNPKIYSLANPGLREEKRS